MAETRRHRERGVRGRLAEAGATTYLPLLRPWPAPAVGPHVVPTFPGYVFVRARPADVHRILRTPGVRGLVTFGAEPAVLDDGVVALLRAREGPDGVMAVAPLAPGATVRIADGPLRGLAAVLERHLPARERVLVLLDLLQRRVAVELPERWIRTA